MWYKTFKNGKKPLLLLHGWGFNSDIFLSILPVLSETYEVTLIDLPGHGRSDIVAGGLDEWVEEISSLVPENATLAGWSLGGLLAIKLAQKIGSKHLILLASTPCFVQKPDWCYGVSANNFKSFSTVLNLNLTKGLQNFVKLQISNKTQLLTINKTIKKHPAKLEALNQGLDILLNNDLRQALLALKADIRVVLGKKDTLIDAKITTWFEQNNISCHILPGGHLPFLHPLLEL